MPVAFLITAAILATCLLLQCAISIKMDASRAAKYGRLITFFASASIVFFPRSQLRIPEIGSVSGPVVLLAMMGIYAALWVLLVSYIQYRKNRDDAQLLRKLIKDATGMVIVLALVFSAILCVELIAFSAGLKGLTGMVLLN